MDYFAPATLREAENLKKKARRTAVYLAGGTILNWKKSPKADCLIDLTNLKLDYVKVSDSRVTLGAMTTIQGVAENKRLPAALAVAAANFSSRNIRNMATVGGSVAGRFFVSDMLPVLLSFKASVEFFKNGTKKTLPLDEWLETRPGLICSLVITRPGRFVSLRSERVSAIDFPLIVTAAGFDVKDGRIRDAVVAVSGASAKTQGLSSAASYLDGRGVKGVSHAELNRVVRGEVELADSIRTPVTVKKRVIESHVKAIVSECKRAAR